MMGCLLVLLLGLGVLAACALAKLMPEAEVLIATGVAVVGAFVLIVPLALQKVRAKWKVICAVIGIGMMAGSMLWANHLHDTKVPLSAAEQFSEEYGVTLELAQSVEDALGATVYQYTLEDVAAWTRTEDWAAGERYNVNMKRDNEEMRYLIVYVYQDQVASIREGADFIYSDDAVNAAADATLNPTESALDTAQAVQIGEVYPDASAYDGQWVEITGTVLSVSEFGDMNGYYLYGEKGSGLCCWVYEDSRSVNVGDTVTFRGQVVNPGPDMVEITDCEVVG